MATPNEKTRPIVRNYQSTDWEAVYDVCTRTGDAGGDAYLTFTDPRVVPDVFAGPYLYLEPDLAFVLDDGQRPVGYVIGTADTAGFVESYARHWLPRVRARYPVPPAEPFTTSEDLFRHLMYQPERMLVPEVLAEYPAHLHIDILPPYQGLGYGRRLIDTFVQAAGRAGAGGVHLGVGLANLRAQGFYLNVGFRRLEVPSAPAEVVYYGRAAR